MAVAAVTIPATIAELPVFGTGPWVSAGVVLIVGVAVGGVGVAVVVGKAVGVGWALGEADGDGVVSTGEIDGSVNLLPDA